MDVDVIDAQTVYLRIAIAASIILLVSGRYIETYGWEPESAKASHGYLFEFFAKLWRRFARGAGRAQARRYRALLLGGSGSALQAEKSEFLQASCSSFLWGAYYNRQVESLRKRDFQNLESCLYLDHAG